MNENDLTEEINREELKKWAIRNGMEQRKLKS